MLIFIEIISSDSRGCIESINFKVRKIGDKTDRGMGTKWWLMSEFKYPARHTIQQILKLYVMSLHCLSSDYTVYMFTPDEWDSEAANSYPIV